MIDILLLKNRIIGLAMQGKLSRYDEKDTSKEKTLINIKKEKLEILERNKGRQEKNINDDFDDIPFEIPEYWSWVKLVDIGFYKKGPFGSSLTKSIFVKENDNTIKVYEQQNAIKHKSNLGSYYITKKYFDEKMQGFEVFGGDIIVSCAGTIGETYIMPDNIKRGIINQALMKVSLVSSVNKEFFCYYFDYNLKKEALKGNGMAMVNIPPFDIMKNWLFPLPSIEEQNRIVKIIKEIYLLIENIDKSQQLYVNNNAILRSKIIEAGISGKLTKQFVSDGNAEDLYIEIQKEKEKLIKEGKIKKEKKLPEIADDEIPFEIPKNWKVVRITDIYDIQTGNSISKEIKAKKYYGLKEGYCYIGTKDVENNHNIIYENGVKIPFGEEKFRIAENGSTLLCIEGGSAGKKIAITKQDVCYGNKLCKFYSKYMEPKFIYYYLQSNAFTSIFKNNLTGLIDGVNIATIKSLVMPLPPLKEQERIVQKIDELLEKV